MPRMCRLCERSPLGKTGLPGPSLAKICHDYLCNTLRDISTAVADIRYWKHDRLINLFLETGYGHVSHQGPAD